ncbi:MAG: extracellular solute-binding protein [Gammaproteobacteria bacterium]|nr:extracellular solute-binding protein [Gammaproteobacteria bacterium]
MRTRPTAPTFLLAVAGAAALAAAEPAFEHGVSFFGDFKYPADFEHFEYVDPDAPKGGMMVLATDTPWNSFTPYLHKGMVAPGVQHDFGSNPFFYDGLFTASDDEIGTFYGNLAEGVMIADDFSRVRVRLRQQARWHDGVPLTARDVRFTFEHIAKNSAFNLQSAFGMVDLVEVHGDHDFTFHLNDRNGLNPAVVSSLGKIAILPEHYWREADYTKTTQTPPLGSGPYRIAEFKQSRSLRYERVPDYWGKNLGVHRGRHNLDAIRYDFYRDDTVAREAFRKGLIDVWRETDPRYWFDRYDDALAKGWLVKRKHNFQYYVGLLSGLVINSRREHLKDARVREALTLAFDYGWHNRVITRGFHTRPDSYFAPSSFAAAGRPSTAEIRLLAPFRDEIPVRVFTEAFELRTSNGIGRNRDLLLEARELLRTAGWVVRNGALTNDGGERLTLSFVLRSVEERRMVIQFVDQLQKLGIDTRLRLVDAAHYVNIMKDFDFDISFGQLGVANPAGVEIVSYWHSSNAMLPRTRNLSGIESEAVDELIMRVLNARSREELTAAQRALDRILLWNFLTIPLIAVEGPNVVYWDKFGRPPVDAEYRTSFPSAWWYDEAKAARIPVPD